MDKNVCFSIGLSLCPQKHQLFFKIRMIWYDAQIAQVLPAVTAIFHEYSSSVNTTGHRGSLPKVAIQWIQASDMFHTCGYVLQGQKTNLRVFDGLPQASPIFLKNENCLERMVKHCRDFLFPCPRFLAAV